MCNGQINCFSDESRSTNRVDGTTATSRNSTVDSMDEAPTSRMRETRLQEVWTEFQSTRHT